MVIGTKYMKHQPWIQCGKERGGLEGNKTQTAALFAAIFDQPTSQSATRRGAFSYVVGALRLDFMNFRSV